MQRQQLSLWLFFNKIFSQGGSIYNKTSKKKKANLTDKSENYFSPKFSTTFSPGNDWQIRFSMALATRFPTVGELYYGGISATGVINNANPDLKPEESFARDFTITRFLGSKGEARLTFFQDDIENTIFRQTNADTLVRNFQNVDDVRTRGDRVCIQYPQTFYRRAGAVHKCGLDRF